MILNYGIKHPPSAYPSKTALKTNLNCPWQNYLIA